MITAGQRTRLEVVVREAHLEQIFRDVDDLARRIDAFCDRFEERARGTPAGVLPAHVSLDDLLAEHDSNPYRVNALLQAIAFVCTPEMLAMIWMVELGAEIEDLKVDYSIRDHARIDATVRLIDRQTQVQFHSEDVWDLAVLRLVGIAKADDRPVLSGIYPLHLPHA